MATGVNGAAPRHEPIPDEVIQIIARTVELHPNVSIQLDFKDGVLSNARYQVFWRRLGDGIGAPDSR